MSRRSFTDGERVAETRKLDAAIEANLQELGHGE